LHGSAFLIPLDEAQGLHRQESGYDVLPCKFESYQGEIIDDVGLYVPKNMIGNEANFEDEKGIPSYHI